VRRLATRLAGVVSARTRARAGADGDDFDLVLLVDEGGAGYGPDHYRAQLARSVRRAELPQAIVLLDHRHADAFGHK
jgi:hypothetical protein